LENRHGVIDLICQNIKPQRLGSFLGCGRGPAAMALLVALLRLLSDASN